MDKKLKSLFITIISVLTFIISMTSVRAAEFEVYFRENTTPAYYLIYSDALTDSASCYYLISDVIVASPAPAYPCNLEQDTNGHNAIIIEDGLETEAKYLYISHNGTLVVSDYLINYSSSRALYSSDEIKVGQTGTKVIVTHHPQSIYVEEDSSYQFHKFIRIKVQDPLYYDLYDPFVSYFLGLTSYNISTNPIEAIRAMSLFYNRNASGYANLIPSFEDSRWEDLPLDRFIVEPDDTEDGDIYVIWLLRYNDGNDYDIDVQVLFSEERNRIVEGQYTDMRSNRLPYTGSTYLIEALFIVNLIALSIIITKRKKLVKSV